MEPVTCTEDSILRHAFHTSTESSGTTNSMVVVMPVLNRWWAEEAEPWIHPTLNSAT